jgi:hypothetical protein
VRAVLVCVAACALVLPNAIWAAQKPKAKPKETSLRELWLLLDGMHRIRTGRSTLAAEAIREELIAIKELPAIRMHCRKLFKVNAVTDETLDELLDWLSLKMKTSAARVYEMKLSEILKFLDKNAK